MTARKRNASGQRKTRRKKTSILASPRLRLLLASLFLICFVGVCLLLLMVLRKTYLGESHPPMEEPPAVVTPQAHSYEDIYALVDAELLNGPLSQGWQRLPSDGGVQRLKMFGDYPEQGRMLELAERIARTGARAYLELLPRKGLVQLYWQDQLRLELRYRVPIDVSSTRPKIAIIMDDMGRTVETARQLFDFSLTITPAILPENRDATASALLMQQAGREYMIHIPMQPKRFPAVNPGPNALLVDQDPTQIRRLMRHYMERVPGAAGGNNHMGSRFTQDSELMRIVLEELQQNSQFFIDSKTISNSVANDEARKMGLPTASRNIFLDNEEDVSYIRAQLRKMVHLSEGKGEVIAICHPHPQTFEALRLEQAWLRQQQVDFVSASQVVHSYPAAQ
jgi:uncharacterized protein